jgi:AbrB family looped-hinge helix DNA binding protein
MSRKVARVQKRGQVTIPIEVRQRLKIKEGDLVAFIETQAGYVISPQAVVSADTLNKVESLLQQKGAALEEVFAFGERLAQSTGGEAQSQGCTPEPSVVEQTAGIFRRQDGATREIDFEKARQAFMDYLARQAALPGADNQA